jgi:maleylpyruvate isomerase
MMRRNDVAAILSVMREGTKFILSVVVGLSDDDFRAPSALPGWTRAHVIGHVARNAEALHRLTLWASTGVETPMYPDLARRAADIESSAALPASTLRRDLASTAARLEEGLLSLGDPESAAAKWHAQVRSALGRAIPATEIPWMRIREVWVHAVDLAAGVTFADLPAEVVDALLDDAVGMLSSRPECPSVQLVAVDRDRSWRLGVAEGTDAVRARTGGTGAEGAGGAGQESVRDGGTAIPAVSATAARLLGWVTGREPGPGGTVVGGTVVGDPVDGDAVDGDAVDGDTVTPALPALPPWL